MLARSPALGVVLVVLMATPGAQERLVVTALSTAPHLVTGGDVLVRIEGGTSTPSSGVKVSVGSRELTAVFHNVPAGYIGFALELPAANTQGATLAETRAGPTSARPYSWSSRRIVGWPNATLPARR